MSIDKTKPDVTLYSTTWCAYCKMAKEYLTSKGVVFKEVDIEHDQEASRAIVAKTGQMGVPVIEIDEQVILGFDRPRIDAALQASGIA